MEEPMETDTTGVSQKTDLTVEETRHPLERATDSLEPGLTTDELMDTEATDVPQNTSSSESTSAYDYPISEFDRIQTKYEEVDDVPSTWNYREIHSNIFHEGLNPLLFDELEEKCPCPDDEAAKCYTDSCPNRAMYVECPPACGESCRNRKIQKHEWITGLQRRLTKDKGYGIFTTTPIKEGDLVAEYFGEIITSEEFKTRMETTYRNDKHHYCFEIGNGLVIDAHQVGNEIRFVNHSCEPNCKMMKWAVKGLPRLALFADRNIEPGEELSYNYHFVLLHSAVPQQCLCGSDKCKGVIGLSVKRDNNWKAIKNPLTSSSVMFGQKLVKWSKADMKPIPKDKRVLIKSKRCFLLANYEEIRQRQNHSEDLQSVGDKLEKILKPWTARYKPGSSRNVPLQIDVDDPNIIALARTSELLYEYFVKLTTVKDKNGAVLCIPFVNLSTSTYHSCQPSTSKDCLDFSEIVRKILRGEFISISSFEFDMRNLLNSSKNFQSEMSDNIKLIDKLFEQLRVDAKKRLEQHDGCSSFLA